MIDDMGIFRTTISVAALASPDRRRELADVIVDTGSEYNWVPRDVLLDLGVAPVRIDRFETADGRVLEREVGFALFYAGERSAAAAVVFADEGDMVLLGAHGLEGLNMRVDLGRKELVPAGPVPAARAVLAGGAQRKTNTISTTFVGGISVTRPPIQRASRCGDLARGGSEPDMSVPGRSNQGRAAARASSAPRSRQRAARGGV
jgi:predicted aspartyl protease